MAHGREELALCLGGRGRFLGDDFKLEVLVAQLLEGYFQFGFCVSGVLLALEFSRNVMAGASVTAELAVQVENGDGAEMVMPDRVVLGWISNGASR